MRMQARYGYMLFILVLLLMSWEAQRNEAPLAEAAIPEQSIRVRILANSDGAHDQWLKRQVRDRVVEQMNTWVTEPMTLEEARMHIKRNLGAMERLVGNTIRENGAAYTYEVKLGEVDFPAKLYGNRVYPDGLYEALVITIGQGRGANWWCVLFPPLCFVDTVTDKTSAAEAEQEEAGKTGAADEQMDNRTAADLAATDEIEMRFFLLDWLDKLIDWIKGLLK